MQTALQHLQGRKTVSYQTDIAAPLSNTQQYCSILFSCTHSKNETCSRQDLIIAQGFIYSVIQDFHEYLVNISWDPGIQDEGYKQLFHIPFWNVQLLRDERNLNTSVGLYELQHDLSSDVLQQIFDILPNEGIIIDCLPASRKGSFFMKSSWCDWRGSRRPDCTKHYTVERQRISLEQAFKLQVNLLRLRGKSPLGAEDMTTVSQSCKELGIILIPMLLLEVV